MQGSVKSTLQTMLNQFRFHIAVLDETGVIVLTNDAWNLFARQNGGSEELGSNYLAVCSEDVQRGFEAVMNGAVDQWEYDYPCHSPQERRFFHMEVKRLTLESEAAPYFMVSHENVTALRLSRFEITSLNATLLAQTEMLAQYTFATTHALQEPLRRLTTTSSALESFATSDERMQRYAQINLKAARQMSSLIDSLGHYAGLVPQTTERLRRVNFGECLQQSADQLGIHLTIEGPVPDVLMGREHARTLARNLMDNFRILRAPDEILEVRGLIVDDFVHVHLRLRALEERAANQAMQLFQPQGRAALGLSQRVTAQYGGRMWTESGGANIGLHLTLPAWRSAFRANTA